MSGNPDLRRRPRRLRSSPALRQLLAETDLGPADLVYPLFVIHGAGQRRPLPSLPGQAQLSVDQLAAEARELQSLGIPGVLLFGVPAHKDDEGSENYDPDGIAARAIRELKDAAPDLLVFSDLCFCSYTGHGHCGIINQPGSLHYQPELPQGHLLNDASLDILARAAVVHARAGADFISPSGMLDGMVAAIRNALDSQGLTGTGILSYAAKFASGFYGPFQHAADSAPAFGDRRTHQLPPANWREAMLELELDEAEGADMLMVKPALAYLDVLAAARMHTHLPLAAYQVSGEYAMLHAAAANGWLDLRRTALESLLAIRRAGADFVISYFAKDAARWLGR
ncbi:MAG: porphobilinogen synthase [Anaerolineaceae bacterium]|nr:porphobilinogen synthase [Anaerolineaceae bacterium]